jgi:hypothetical protein
MAKHVVEFVICGKVRDQGDDYGPERDLKVRQASTKQALKDIDQRLQAPFNCADHEFSAY